MVWRSDDLTIWRSATEDGFEFLDALSRPARIGALAYDLFGGPTGRFDLRNELLGTEDAIGNPAPAGARVVMLV